MTERPITFDALAEAEAWLVHDGETCPHHTDGTHLGDDTRCLAALLRRAYAAGRAERP